MTYEENWREHVDVPAMRQFRYEGRGSGKGEMYWSEAATQEVIAVLERWFWDIEKGIANYKQPDLSLPRYTKGEVDETIQYLDDFIAYEINSCPNYWIGIGMHTKGVDIDMPTDFNRLRGTGREAFVQEVKEKVREIKARWGRSD